MVAGNTTDTTYYMGSFEYKNGELNQVFTSEGRVRYDETSGDYHYDYYLKDHLGNTRVLFTDSAGTAQVLQVSNYYPFGMQFNQAPAYQQQPNDYLYNGKEKQAFGLDCYDYGARFYDASLARFHSVDPKAKEFYFQSPYVYAANDPVKFIDQNGENPFINLNLKIIMGVKKINNWVKSKQAAANKSFNNSMNVATTMDKPDTKSKGADIIEFGVSAGVKLPVKKSSYNIGDIGLSFVLNEDKGAGIKTNAKLGNDNLASYDQEMRFYQKDGSMNVESNSSINIANEKAKSNNNNNDDLKLNTPFLKINFSAIGRSINNFNKTIKEYCQEKVDRITKPKNYYPNEKEK